MKITIDGKEVIAEVGQTILEVAREAGIYIPSLCWHPRTGPSARCRACVVEVEGMRGLVTACHEKAADGMVIRTDTEQVQSVRRSVVELQLSSGNHDCLACEACGNCELQDMAYRLGIESPPYLIDQETPEADESSEGIIIDHSRCIHCGRCIEGCNSGVMHEVLAMGNRGNDSRVICDNDRPMGESSCVQCGECAQLCPVGAIIYKTARGKARNWEVERRRTVCPYCGVGCVIDIAVADNRYLWAEGCEHNWENLPNQGMLCVKGRFGLEYVNHPDRLTKPLIRKNGELVETSWDEALDYVADRLAQIKSDHGGGAIGCLSSAKTTNEENFAMQRFARAVIGTNNVDHCARLCHSSTVAGLATTLGSGAMTNSMQETLDTDVFLITGSNTTWCHPVFGGLIKRAVKRHGKKLIVVDPRENDLAKIADHYVRQRGGSDVAWLMGVQRIIVENGWHDEDFIKEHCEGWDDYRESLEAFTLEKVEEISGILPEDLEAIARMYATGGTAAIYFSMGITQHTHGVDNVKAVANLALICGNLGKRGGGVNPLRGQSNVQGACDMGALPNVFSGYQKVTDVIVREKFARVWGVEPSSLDDQVGLTVTQMVQECGKSIRSLYIMGENPMLSDPNLNHLEQQLGKLDLLVVQDIFLTETASRADVVLPAVPFTEKTGTYTNTERRVQLARRAIPPLAGCRQDYEIIAQLAARLGVDNFPRTPDALFAEIKQLTPSYHGMTYERLDDVGLRWPCPTEDHPGTAILHSEGIIRGRGQLSPLAYRPPAESCDGNYPLLLSTGRMLEHFHGGSMSRRSVVLDHIAPHAVVEIHPDNASPLGINDGEMIDVETRRGKITLRANVTEAVDRGMLYIPFHFVEAAANRLTSDALDPVSKIPEYKVCAARVSRSESP